MIGGAWTAFVAAVLSTTLVLVTLYLVARAHRRRLAAVPVRIHVAGSRGKTSTARLIGAGLTAGGWRVLVKTTGTVPLVILPDGRSEPWPRSGPPSISELVRFFRVAEDWKAEVVVVESMGIAPEYLWASEHYLVRATHVVVTNLRPDHEEVLEGSRAAMSEAVALVMPSGGRVLLTPESAAEPILESCSTRGCVVNVVSTADLLPLEVNRRLALAVCAEVGVPSGAAERGMARAQPDPGAFFIAEVGDGEAVCSFANAFSCNDIISFLEVWNQHRRDAPTVALLNARADRPLRTIAFLDALARLNPRPRLVLAGPAPRRWALAAGFAPENVARLRARRAEDAVAELAEAAGNGGMVWGVGNYAGLGAEIMTHLRGRERPC